MKKIVLGMASLALVFGFASIANASTTLFGDASIVDGGNPGSMVQVTSGSTAPGYGGVSFSLLAGTVVSDLATLGIDYKVLAGDCGGGSPRFSVRTSVGNIFIYLGPTPNFNSCPSGWQSTGNLLSDVDLRVDATQVGGTFYDTWAHAKILVGSEEVIRLSLVVDASWAMLGGIQSFGFDNADINGTLYDFTPHPENKDQCKNNGWRDLFHLDNSLFKNQGDCVSFVASNDKAKGNP